MVEVVLEKKLKKCSRCSEFDMIFAGDNLCFQCKEEKAKKNKRLLEI